MGSARSRADAAQLRRAREHPPSHRRPVCRRGGLAAQSASAAGRIVVTVVTARYWEVGIANSASHRVAAGGRYIDCASAPIADLGVVVDLQSTPAGVPYSIVLIGPPVAGRTPVTQEGDFNGKGGNVNPVFLTLGFPKLKAIGVADFPPGASAS